MQATGADGKAPPQPGQDLVMLYAAMVGEPFLLTMDEIGELTDWQIERVYGHPRNKQTGQVEERPPDVPQRLTLEQRRAQYISLGLALNQRLEVLERTWREKHGD